MNNICKFSFILVLLSFISFVVLMDCEQENTLTADTLMKKIINYIPKLNDKRTKGDAGKIGVIGGSIEYTGAPYFAAISALKVGADLVYVITTKDAAPVIKSYSPELIVYPFLNIETLPKIKRIIHKLDIVVIGPGLGRENDTMALINLLLEYCKNINKPLVVDADGLYAISINLDIIKGYPSPGVILTPNIREKDRLMKVLEEKYSDVWFKYWGENVSVLIKGHEDMFHSPCKYKWVLSEGGSGRRAGGQGDILSGSLGTLFNWAIKSNDEPCLKRAVAAYSAAKFTRECNSLSYSKLGRSMTASDMIMEIHTAFKNIFEK